MVKKSKSRENRENREKVRKSKIGKKLGGGPQRQPRVRGRQNQVSHRRPATVSNGAARVMPRWQHATGFRIRAVRWHGSDEAVRCSVVV